MFLQVFGLNEIFESRRENRSGDEQLNCLVRRALKSRYESHIPNGSLLESLRAIANFEADRFGLFR